METSSCPKPDPCKWENGRDRSGDVCYFPPASITTDSDIHCAPLGPPKVIELQNDWERLPLNNEPLVFNFNPFSLKDPKITHSQPTKNETQRPCLNPPDENYPLEVKVLNLPKKGAIQQTLAHPLCPDAQLTLNIQPQVKKEREIIIPPCKNAPVRPPQREWAQCIENQRICDRVRRPMAKICHRRPIPPLVLPCAQFQRIKESMDENERERAEREGRCHERECERLKSRYRHSLWNYTVESLLERKREEEREKEKNEEFENNRMIQEMRREKERESEEARQKAKKLMLYRKGLIRDFHSSMANSKLMKEIEDETFGPPRCVSAEKGLPPFLNTVCMKKMAWINSRPEYKKEKEEKKCSQKLVETIVKDEKRIPEREAELNYQKCIANNLRTQCALPWPEAYQKYIAEPVCDPETRGKEENLKKAEKRKELWENIQDRLTIDSFIEAREKEEERQAQCYANYAREKYRLIKEREKQLIDEKVARNIASSEKVAEKLAEMKAMQQGRADVYDELKEQWEKDYESKKYEALERKSKKMGLVYKDFWERRNQELCKKQLLDASRHWARERLDAVENYEAECEIQKSRKAEAEELALYHKAQIADKQCREAKNRHLDRVYDAKSKKEFEDEVKEMKDYAQECIKEWGEKGRPLQPLYQAMKKWDYDQGMYPFPPIQEKCADVAKDIYYQTTASRLGFDCFGKK